MLLATLAWTRLSSTKLTPRLDVKSDDRLGDGLRLGGLLLTVSSETLLTDLGSLSILLLVVTAEQVDIIIILRSLLGGIGGVDGQVSRLRAVGRVSLGGVARESGELALVRGNVLVPSGGVRVLLSVGSLLGSLEDGDISLRGTVTIGVTLAFYLIE